MSAQDNLQPRQFFHGTNAPLREGDMIVPGMPKAHSASTGEHVYFGNLDTALFAGDGAVKNRGGDLHLYQVEPTGRYEPDPDSPASRWGENAAYRTASPLRVTREMQRMGRMLDAHDVYGHPADDCLPCKLDYASGYPVRGVFLRGKPS